MIKMKMVNGIYTFSSVLLIIALSWLTLYKVNFFYGFWHDHGGIAQTIEYFSPKNKHISNFEHTTKAERIRVFKHISYAVHIDASELNAITFKTAKSGQAQRFLHQREIIHLIDVSHAINTLYIILIFGVSCWLYSLRYYLRHNIKLPSRKVQLLSMAILVGLVGICIVLIGPEALFYWFHQVIFPENHQWFFYYEDSLMSTLMSAPDLFGWIAFEWLILFIAYFFVIHYLCDFLVCYRLKKKH